MVWSSNDIMSFIRLLLAGYVLANVVFCIVLIVHSTVNLEYLDMSNCSIGDFFELDEEDRPLALILFPGTLMYYSVVVCMFAVALVAVSPIALCALLYYKLVNKE